MAQTTNMHLKKSVFCQFFVYARDIGDTDFDINVGCKSARSVQFSKKTEYGKRKFLKNSLTNTNEPKIFKKKLEQNI